MNGERPPLETLLQSIEAHRKTRDWQKDRGQYIPHPSTWLNAHGWEDEITLAYNQHTDPWRPHEHIR